MPSKSNSTKSKSAKRCTTAAGKSCKPATNKAATCTAAARKAALVDLAKANHVLDEQSTPAKQNILQPDAWHRLLVQAVKLNTSNRKMGLPCVRGWKEWLQASLDKVVAELSGSDSDSGSGSSSGSDSYSDSGSESSSGSDSSDSYSDSSSDDDYHHSRRRRPHHSRRRRH